MQQLSHIHIRCVPCQECMKGRVRDSHCTCTYAQMQTHVSSNLRLLFYHHWMKTWLRSWVPEAAKYPTFLLRLAGRSCCERASPDRHRTPKLCLSVSSVWCLRTSSGWREPSLQTRVSSKTHSHIHCFKPVLSVTVEILSTDGFPLLIPLWIFYPKFLYCWPHVKRTAYDENILHTHIHAKLFLLSYVQ